MEAAWYVDEERPDRLRWRSEEGWGLDTVRPDALVRRLRAARAWLALAVLAMACCAVTMVLATRTDLRLVSLIDLLPSLADDPVAQAAARREVDEAGPTATGWTWVPLAVAAVAWSAWIHHVAQLLPSRVVRRTADQHALLWWVPGANLVAAPLLLVEARGLLRGRPARRPGVLVGAWWVVWVALCPWTIGVLVQWTRMESTADLRAHLLATVPLQLAVAVAAVLAAAVAVVVTRDATAYVARVPAVGVRGTDATDL